MNRLQLKLCDIQGRLFELSGRIGCNSEKFISVFMNSQLARALDSKYNRMHWAGEEYLLEEVLVEAGNAIPKDRKVFDSEVMYWIGYLYRYWCITRSESSAKVYKQANAKTMNRNYTIFHTMDPELAIEDLIEIHRQKEDN